MILPKEVIIHIYILIMWLIILIFKRDFDFYLFSVSHQCSFIIYFYVPRTHPFIFLIFKYFILKLNVFFLIRYWKTWEDEDGLRRTEYPQKFRIGLLLQVVYFFIFRTLILRPKKTQVNLKTDVRYRCLVWVKIFRLNIF